MNDSDRRNNIFACAVAMVLSGRVDDQETMVKCGKAMDKLVCDDDIEYAQGWAEATLGMEGMAKMLQKKTGKMIDKKPTKKAEYNELVEIAHGNYDKLTHEQQIYVTAVSMAKDMRDANIGKVLVGAAKLAKLINRADWDKARELLGVGEYDEPVDGAAEKIEEIIDKEDKEGSEPDLKDHGDGESFSM